MKRLYILYKDSSISPVSGEAVLSFMPPDEEYRAASRFQRFFFGRKEMDAIRENTRKKYVDIVSRIAATPCHGKTLRQALEIPGCGNPWWYHAVSEKQVERDDTFNRLLQIFTAMYVADREGAYEIVIYGAPVEVISVLKTKYKTTGMQCQFERGTSLIRATLSRIKYLFDSLRAYHYMKRIAIVPIAEPNIVFQGFWGWSLKIDDSTGKADDKYFKALPDKLRGKGAKCAWFLWVGRKSGDAPGCRSAIDALGSATVDAEFIFVQKFLRMMDIPSLVFDMRPAYRYLRFSRSDEFKAIFKEDGCDMMPLFRNKLAYGFCDSSLPHNYLMETAFKRAFAFYKPKVSFSFLELYLSARAFNQGAILGSPATVKCDMQHASYAREKTFILADPEMEFSGKPDGKAMPSPDRFFVMGELCRDILLENGISAEKIFMTGSARFDHMENAGNKPRSGKASDPAKVLLVSTLNVRLDFEMVRAAPLASEGLRIRLFLRSHPFAKMEEMPAYKRYRDAFTLSNVSLEEDLNSADLLLFTYSTVGEEAFLRGIPVVRWQANGFNGSVFRDIGVVPSAYSVESLRREFRRLLEDPDSLRPDEKLKDLVLRKCFYKTDGMASDRIAGKAVELLARS
ncbi:MAG: hypothetical protein NTY76_02480 [Candidatus Omnitrophica bacterium]|nr:hypothetical protein [Candidatus Omnitrophota bacterium]